MRNGRRLLRGLILGLLLSLILMTVYAHDGSNVPFGGFLAGLVHPVLRYDHFLAMLCVGILSAQIGGKAIWTVPATFVGVMAIGGVLGLIGSEFQYIELGIAFSLIILGIV